METTKNKTKSVERVHSFRASLGRQEASAIKQAMESGWLGTGIYTKLFESRLARELRTRSSLATNSGTAALHLALKALNVEGGEVITTPVTSVATNHAILYNRAAPVFCDVEADTGNIDAGQIESLITPRTRAVIAVHLGHACDMDAILSIARRRHVPVVEDVCACHAVGGFFRDRALGTMGDIGAFSFGRFKGLTTLDGGALIYRRETLRPRLSRLRRLGHAEDKEGMVHGPRGVSELGFHYRMNDIASVIGMVQFDRRAAIQRRLDKIMARYRDGLRSAPWIKWPATKPYSRGVRAYAAVSVLGGRREVLRRKLIEGGIQVNDRLFPNHCYALYRPFRRRLPVAERYCAETLHLPYYPDLSDGQVDRIVDIISGFRG